MLHLVCLVSHLVHHLVHHWWIISFRSARLLQSISLRLTVLSLPPLFYYWRPDVSNYASWQIQGADRLLLCCRDRDRLVLLARKGNHLPRSETGQCSARSWRPREDRRHGYSYRSLSIKRITKKRSPNGNLNGGSSCITFLNLASLLEILKSDSLIRHVQRERLRR